jgi:hypothetical protein
LIGLGPPSIAAHDAGTTHDAATGPDGPPEDAGTEAVAAADAGDAADAASEDAPSGPPALVSGVNVGPLATDATYVYWLDPTRGQVMRCPIAGCPSGATVFYSLPGYDPNAGWNVGGIVAQSGSIYFAVNPPMTCMLLQCPSSGCGSPSYIVKGTSMNGGIYGITADSSRVYFGMGVGLFDCPLQGGCSVPPPALVAGPGVSAGVDEIAVVNGSVYFATPDPQSPVGECSTTGCGGMPSLFNSPVRATALGVAANASAVYWTTAAGEVFMSHSSTSSTVVFAPAPAQSPGAIVADDNAVYFGSQQSGGAIFSCPPPGCGGPPKLVAGNLGNVKALAIDPNYIYAGVSTGQSGEIIEIAR